MALPQHRELVTKLKDQPFTLLGINSDPDRSVLTKRFAEEKITWPNICEGMGGPVSKQYHVRKYPMIYVIDHEGIIRHRDLFPWGLENAVRELLKKVPKGES